MTDRRRPMRWLYVTAAVLAVLFLGVAAVATESGSHRATFDFTTWRLADLVILVSLAFNIGATVTRIRFLEQRVRELFEWTALHETREEERRVLFDGKISKVHERIDKLAAGA